MIETSVSPKATVDYLNSLLEIDRVTISELFTNKTYCQDMSLPNHPTVQVSQYVGLKGYTVRPLGIINGLFGSFDSGDHKGWGPIYMEIDEQTGLIQEFSLVINKE